MLDSEMPFRTVQEVMSMSTTPRAMFLVVTTLNATDSRCWLSPATLKLSRFCCRHVWFLVGLGPGLIWLIEQLGRLALKSQKADSFLVHRPAAMRKCWQCATRKSC